MKPESTNRLFRTRLYDMESEVPDHIWSSVEARIRPRPNRRWWLLLLLVPLTLGVTLFSLSGHRGTLSNHDEDGFEDLVSAEPSLLGAPDSSEMVQSEFDFGKDESEKIIRTTPVDSDKSTVLAQEVRSSGANILTAKKKRSAIKADYGTSNQRYARVTRAIAKETFPKKSREHLMGKHRLGRSTDLFEAIVPLEFGVWGSKDPKLDVCPTFSVGRTQVRPFVELSVQAGRPFRTLSARNAESSNYRTLREDTEQVQFDFAVMGLAGLEIGRHVEVKAGIGYRQIHEVFDYIDQSASRTIVQTITDTIHNNGIPTVIIDTSVVTEYGQRIKRSNNKLRFLEIPIIGGYNFDIGKHRVLLSGGVAVNLAFGQKGDILAPDQSIVSIGSQQSDGYSIYKTKAGLDILANLGYELYANQSNAVSIMASFRWSLKDLTRSDYPLTQKYSSINLGLALKHRF